MLTKSYRQEALARRDTPWSIINLALTAVMAYRDEIVDLSIMMRSPQTRTQAPV